MLILYESHSETGARFIASYLLCTRADCMNKNRCHKITVKSRVYAANRSNEPPTGTLDLPEIDIYSCKP